ncbi:MAG: hypothetical protein OHK0031_01220 [Anaerolineales bacterium]
MNRGNLFWGLVLIALGGLFFLQARGLIAMADIWGYFAPIVLILAGLWVLSGAFKLKIALDESNSFSVSLDGAQKLIFDFDTGMGQAFFGGGAPQDLAVRGASGAGLEVHSRREGDTLKVEVDAGPSVLPMLGPESGGWRFELNESLPLSLDIDAGASSLDFDLRPLRLTSLKLDCGASSIRLTLPERSESARVDFQMGAASLDVTVPQGVALRLKVTGGANSLTVDESRFPLSADGFYQSPDFAAAPYKVEMSLEGGANSVQIH